MIKAVIIDDVPQAIASLQQDLRDYCPEVEVTDTADGVVNGAKLLRKQKPDILFLDVQLGDGTGFDLLDILSEIPFKVIFTTSSDAFAVRAFRMAAVDYLLKPVQPDELQEAVGRAKELLGEQPKQLDLLKNTLNGKEGNKRIALHTLDKIHLIELEQIIRCEAQGNYTTFYLNDGQKIMVTKTLKEYDRILSEVGFLRVHQSHLINLKQIQAFVKTDGGYLLMRGGNRIPVSVRKRAEVVKMLDRF
ncbi:MAG: DNA-binding response regulator [Saprospiraceae bacterium]|nr:MAG: DNA-binding response regulator [Saprospiraceae bacterium]